MVARKSIVQLGCGNMGGALLRLWRDKVDAEYWVVSPNGDKVPDGVSHAKAASLLPIDLSIDVLVLATKPQISAEALAPLRPLLRPETQLFSIAAGLSIASLRELSGLQHVVRMMPNLPAQIGKSTSGLFACKDTPVWMRSLSQELSDSVGTTHWVESEDELDKLTAVAGSGPGFFFELFRAHVEAAKELGFSEAKARDLVLGTAAGSAAMAQKDPRPLSIMRDAVTSKKGTTEAGLAALGKDDRVSQAFSDALRSAYERACQLR